MSKIFISGAAGFIGSQLSYYLLKKGYHVTLLDNFSYGVEDNLIFPDCDFRGKIIRGDIRDKKLINELFKKNKFDYVYHIAAITPLPDCQMNPIEAVDVNITGTLTILEASLFSKTFHRNFNQYLNDARLNYACHRLENTSDSITNICLGSGFESQRTFNRVFKERYKISPSDYRSTCVKEMLS